MTAFLILERGGCWVAKENVERAMGIEPSSRLLFYLE